MCHLVKDAEPLSDVVYGMSRSMSGLTESEHDGPNTRRNKRLNSRHVWRFPRLALLLSKHQAYRLLDFDKDSLIHSVAIKNTELAEAFANVCV